MVSAPAAPILQAIIPLGAVPERLRAAVTRVLETWGYGWDDLTFAGVAALPAGEHWQLELHSEEVWVLAVTAGPLSVGDELELAGGRSAGVGVSRFSGGVIPVTPYQARVCESLGRRGSGPPPERHSPPAPPTTADTAPVAPDPLR